MEITEVSTYTGHVVRRAKLAEMEGVEFRLYANSRHACRPFAVYVEWPIPMHPESRPSSVQVKGARLLKSGELGDTETKRFYNSDAWPQWLQVAVAATRPSLEDLAAER